MKYKIVITLTLLTLAIAYLFQNQLIWYKVYPLQYRDYVWENSDKYNLDPYLVLAIMKIESRFDPEAVSSRGASGLMQLMPETANWIATQNNFTLTENEVFDPELNIMMGTWYINQLLNQFGDETLAIASYNAGRRNVQRWLEESIWDGTLEDAENIPFLETKNYVLRVTIAWQKYRDIYVK